MGVNLLYQLELPDRYQLLRHVANGGMASVWCAQDVVLGRRVAIKVLDERFQHDEVAVRRLGREARAAARLSTHPHVVTIFDVGETDGRPFIVMEHLAGGTVAEALRRGPIAREDALRWLEQAADALDHAHRRGIVHRDIKPGNLLLDIDRVLHIGDFGIARLASEDTITLTGQLLGTAAYLSPEQALGRPGTAASDRYALSVVAFELLTGERPFKGEHFAVQARQHIEQPPPRASRRNPALPAALDAVLARGMAKQPRERWPTARALVAEIKGALSAPAPAAATRRHAAAPAAPVRPLTRASRPAPVVVAGRRRGRRGAALAALAAVALAAGAVAGAAGTGRNAASPARNAGKRGIRPARGHAPPRAPAVGTSTVARSPAPASASAPAPVPAPAPAPSADALETRGHQLMVDGSYGPAIAVLRQALAAAGSSSLTYAYALYDLGRSLRLAGDPQAAIPILERRLQIPNQTGVVRQELALALQAVGGPGPGPQGPGGDAGHHKHDHRGGGD